MSAWVKLANVSNYGAGHVAFTLLEIAHGVVLLSSTTAIVFLLSISWRG
jgi:hypothetical protein